MAAAAAISRAGWKVAVLEREEHLGGILLQCIHNGFGLHHFKKELTGPEYAEECIRQLTGLPADICLETTVVGIEPGTATRTVTAYSARHGVLQLTARAVVLAMGCRERNRGNIGIPGSRPAGVFTAGLAQRLLNIDGCVPGKRVVIVGSGDIGLIMARRLTWVGSRVLAVVEILPYPSGLTRNIVQCLEDNRIPLYLSHAVTRIRGRDRVSGAEIAPLVNGVPAAEKSFSLNCDTVLLSVGLIPENELSRTAGVELSPSTGGPKVDHSLQTSCPGIFACGNVLHVHDLVDFVSAEAEACGRNVAEYLKGTVTGQAEIPVTAGPNLKYVIPNSCAAGRETRFLMRPQAVFDQAELVVRQGERTVHAQKLKRVRPAEMMEVKVPGEWMQGIKNNEPLEFILSAVEPREKE